MPTASRQLESLTSYPADGVTTAWNFSFSSGYLDQSHVKAYKLSPTGVRTEIPVSPAMFLGPYQLSISPPVPDGYELTIYRATPTDAPLVDFTDRSAFTETSMDTAIKQAVFAAAETVDALSVASERIDTISTLVDNANTYANNAQTSANDAAGSANLASLWATSLAAVSGGLFGARKYANDAATSAGNAATSEQNAAASALSVNQANLVHLAGAETITGVKTFSAQPVGITAASVGLGNVNNTSDANKPVSTAQQAALNALGYIKNKVRNGNFVINQRAKSGTVTLAAGIYGQDGWKAGAGGCTYTFAASGNRTILTISAGSLVQAIEDVLLEPGQYTLSNQGTAQARIAVNGAALSGAFTACPLVSAAVTGGLSGAAGVLVEFSTGTLDRVQLEAGLVATSFDPRLYAAELMLNQRYFEVVRTHTIGTASGVMYFGCMCYYKSTKRAIPSVTWGADIVTNNANSKSVGDITAASMFTTVLSVGSGSCEYAADLNVSAEL